MAVVLTLVQTKQIRINVHKPNSTKNTYTLPKHPHITKPTRTHTHTLEKKLKQPHYKLKQTQYKIYPN